MKIGILGGGTMGLTLAHRLAQAGHEPVVLEAAAQPGGLATWFDYDGFVWDKFYHVICGSDSSLIGLIDEIGIREKLRFSNTKSGFFWNGRHLSMSSNWEFLTFPALSLIDKARLAAGILYCQRINDPGPLERIKASDWLRRIFGKRCYSAMWEPLLESKFGVLKDEMPATLMWATIRRYYSTRSKGGGKENLGFLSGGMKTFYNALIASVERQGGAIRCSTPVQSIAEDGPSKVIVEAGGERLVFDRFISTAPTSVFERIAPGIEGIVQESRNRPRFLGVICMSLVLRRPLSPYYITNLIQKGFPFTGIIEVSNLCGAEELNGNRLVMLPRYDTPDSEWFDMSAKQIADEFMPALKSACPDIEENLVRYFINIERTVQAVWTENPPPAAPKPGVNSLGTVWSANAELTGRDTCAANLAAEEIIPALTRKPSAAAAAIMD